MITRRIEHSTNNKFSANAASSILLHIIYLFFRVLMDKFNDYEVKKTQLLHQEQPPSQEELDEVEEMITSMEKKEAERCRDVIAKLSKYMFYFMLHSSI